MALASQCIHCRRVLPSSHSEPSTARTCHANFATKYMVATYRSGHSSSRQHGPEHSRLALAVSAASQEQEITSPPHGPVLIENDTDPDALLGILRSTKNYTQLAAYIKSQQQVFLKSPLCVYALLHAVQLRDTISEDNFGKGYLSSEDKILQHMELVRGRYRVFLFCESGFLTMQQLEEGCSAQLETTGSCQVNN